MEMCPARTKKSEATSRCNPTFTKCKWAPGQPNAWLHWGEWTTSCLPNRGKRGHQGNITFSEPLCFLHQDVQYIIKVCKAGKKSTIYSQQWREKENRNRHITQNSVYIIKLHDIFVLFLFWFFSLWIYHTWIGHIGIIISSIGHLLCTYYLNPE